MVNSTHTPFKEARIRAGLTVKQCAELLEINPVSVRRFEMDASKSGSRTAPALSLKVLDWFARGVPPS